MTSPEPEARPALSRSLGLGSAVAAVVGEVVGVGIFLTPADMARSLGSPFWLLVCWLLMGGMAASGALCYGELAARFPEAGGGYVYLRRAYGPRVAFLYGWKSLIVMDPGLTAALAIGLASYVSYATGLARSAEKAVAVAAIVLIAAVNIRGVRFGAGMLRATTALKLLLMAVLILWGFAGRLGDWKHFVPFVAQRPGATPLPGALAAGFVAAFFSFGGWWDTAKLGGEVRDPGRVLPRAFLMGVTIVLALYILTSAVFLYLVPLEQVTTGEAFAAQAGEVLFGRAGAQVFSWIVVVSVVSSLAGLMMAAPRVYFAMARDGVFPAAMAQVHPRYGTPARAIVLQSALACLLVLIGSFGQIIAYFIFITVAFVAATVAAIFIFRRRDATAPPFRMPGYPVPAVIFLSLIAVLLALILGNNPRQAALGVAVVALGVPLYSLVFQKRRFE